MIFYYVKMMLRFFSTLHLSTFVEYMNLICAFLAVSLQ